MELRPDNTLISNREMLIELVLAPFRKIGSVLTGLAVSNARSQALMEIAAIPEEQLRARGITRSDLIMMTFRHDA